MKTNWSNRYVGLPYAPLGRAVSGCDCWGLACIVYAAERDIVLPNYLGYGSEAEAAELASVISGAVASPLWRAVNLAAQPFDIVVMRRGRLASHVGLVVEPGLMLHMVEDQQSRIESFAGGMWQHRVVGLYRHADLAGDRAI